MKVIAFSAWKGSGKDLLASHLIDTIGAQRTAFADPLKDMTAEEYSIQRQDMDSSLLKETAILKYPVEPQDGFSRMIAEFLIKEFRTKSGIQPNTIKYENGKFLGVIKSTFNNNVVLAEQVFWTPRALCIFKGSGNRSVASNYWVQQAIKKIKESNKILHVITDTRFKSEINQLKEAFGKDLITVRVNRFANSPSDDPSERDCDDAIFDYAIENKGTKKEAFAKIEEIVEEILGLV